MLCQERKQEGTYIKEHRTRAKSLFVRKENSKEKNLRVTTNNKFESNIFKMEASSGGGGSEEKGMFEYFGWVYHLGLNSIGHEYCHLRFLFIRGKYVSLYKRDPHQNPGIVHFFSFHSHLSFCLITILTIFIFSSETYQARCHWSHAHGRGAWPSKG